MRYNLPIRKVHTEPEPMAKGVKILHLQKESDNADDSTTCLLYTTTEGLHNGDPIVPREEIMECLADKLAVFHITEGVLSIYDVEAFRQKKANHLIEKRKLDFDTYDVEFFALKVTKNYGSRYNSGGVRHLNAKDGSPLYAEISIKLNHNPKDIKV